MRTGDDHERRNDQYQFVGSRPVEPNRQPARKGADKRRNQRRDQDTEVPGGGSLADKVTQGGGQARHSRGTRVRSQQHREPRGSDTEDWTDDPSGMVASVDLQTTQVSQRA